MLTPIQGVSLFLIISYEWYMVMARHTQMHTLKFSVNTYITWVESQTGAVHQFL